jgi:hypothetical protein
MCGRAIDIIAEMRKFGAVVEGFMYKTNEGSGRVWYDSG